MKCLGRFGRKLDLFEWVGVRDLDQARFRQHGEQHIKLSYVETARLENLRWCGGALGLRVQGAVIRLAYDYVEELSSWHRDSLQAVV